MFTLYVLQRDGWSKFHEIIAAFVAFTVFGFAMLPMNFLFSMIFSIPSTGFVRMTIIYIFTGTTTIHFQINSINLIFYSRLTGITFFLLIVAMSFPEFKLIDKANTLKLIFLAFPHYSLCSCLDNLHKMSATSRVCEQKRYQIPKSCNQTLLCNLINECCRKCNI